jgi:sn-1 stearoyl-lipid 9-desaturase
MSLIDKMLQPPAYGWTDENGNLFKPTNKQIIAEFFHRLNIFRDRRCWLQFFNWSVVITLLPFAGVFLAYHFSWTLFIIALVYSLCGMGTHGTIWFHRYGTHRAYVFSGKAIRFITQNLVIRVMPEEVYILSHHVHHAKADKPGDPYNAQGGWLYCFLADVNHQAVSRDLDPESYHRLVQMLSHTGVRCNSYSQYLKWGSVSRPGYVITSTLANWAAWLIVFAAVGGMPLVSALFGAAGLWALGIRTFNYQGHGRGKDKRKEGVDFNWKDMSINELRPGILTGEWHNNHHLFPNSAKAGFLPHQIDFAWYYIKLLHKLGGVSSYIDSTPGFFRDYYEPFKKQLNQNPQDSDLKETKSQDHSEKNHEQEKRITPAG